MDLSLAYALVLLSGMWLYIILKHPDYENIFSIRHIAYSTIAIAILILTTAIILASNFL